MSDVKVPRLSFGTAAAVFPSPAAAEEAAATLARQGYPRELITVLTGEPWDPSGGREAGLRPDPELRFRLLPASPDDAASLKHDAAPVGPLARFIGADRGHDRRRNVALWPLLALAAGAVAILLAFYSRDWFIATIVILVAIHAIVGVLVMTYSRDHETSFPFRHEIPLVEETLERGGALVTVRCTLPYRSRVESVLVQAGGQVLGYAPEVVYPVPAA